MGRGNVIGSARLRGERDGVSKGRRVHGRREEEHTGIGVQMETNKRSDGEAVRWTDR